MSANLKNFASGKNWWYMEKATADKLLDAITDYYNDKLSKNVDVLFEPEDISLYTAEIKQELMKTAPLFFKNIGIKLEDSKIG
jgi:CRISPR/Cas system endoribonuclease Cas6 (RAMP superfamily)